MIYVPDVRLALTWYTSIGFKEIARYEDDGLVNFGKVSFGKAALMLNMHGQRGPQGASLWFYTDQVDALYQLLKSRQMAAAEAALVGTDSTAASSSSRTSRTCSTVHGSSAFVTRTATSCTSSNRWISRDGLGQSVRSPQSNRLSWTL